MEQRFAHLLKNDLLRLPHFDTAAESLDLSANAYAVLFADRSVLVDAAFTDVLPDVRALIATGFTPVAVVLTHRDAALLRRLSCDKPVFLHPQESEISLQKRGKNEFTDPTDNALLLSCGLQVLLSTDTEQKHLMLYQQSGQLLFAGDCALGPSLSQTTHDNWTIQRPSSASDANDLAMREMWRAFDLPVTTFCPFWGEPLVDQPDLIAAALIALRR